MLVWFSRWRPVATVAIAFVSATALADPQTPAPAEAVAGAIPASNLEMAKRLKRIAGQARREGLLYRNDKRVEQMRAQQASSREPLAYSFRLNFAIELLRAGDPEAALEQLERAVQAAEAGNTQLKPEDHQRLDQLRALSHMRHGEQQNCILNHTVDSCLLPIKGAGVHKLQEGSRAAIGVYRKLLAEFPDDLNYRWLLNLAHMTVGEYPEGVPERWRLPVEIFESDYEVPRLFDVATGAGIVDPRLSGGVVMEDFNGDGFLDLMTSSWGVLDQLRYFQSNGDGTFTDRTEEAGLTGLVGGLNLNHADYDNDGRPDVLVLRGAWLGENGKYPNSLLRNRPDGIFEDVTEEAGVLSFHPTQAAAWADYDGDGWLDLFIGNESRSRTHLHPCELYRNNGDGTFTDVAPEVGLDHVGFVKAVAWGDYDNDGRIDLYLSRMFQPNVLYRNEGPFAAMEGVAEEPGLGWIFTDVTYQAGVAAPQRSFPTWFFDYDNDGWLDLMVASFSDFGGAALDSVVADYLDLPTTAERARLYHNEGDGTFEDVSEEMNVSRVLLAMGANFGDIDNDGYLDMYFGTGEPSMSTLVPNVMFRNAGAKIFQDVTTTAGVGHIQKGHGIAFGDLDNDGDQDIYAVMGGAYSGDVYQNVLFENPGMADHHWVTLRLEGTHANRMAIGARVRITVEDGGDRTREIHRVVGSGGSFGSSSLQLEVGLGRASRIASLDISWPGGGQSHFEDVPMDRAFRVSQGQQELQPLELHAFELPAPGTGHHEHHVGPFER